jgi:hypothetical protein
VLQAEAAAPCSTQHGRGGRGGGGGGKGGGEGGVLDYTHEAVRLVFGLAFS